MSHWNKKQYSPKKEKKTFTIDDIKEDFDMSLFVTRLFFTDINFEWICVNVDGIQKSKINKFVEKLKILGLVTTQNFVKVPDKLIDVLNKTLPNYYNNVDRKTTIVYRRTKTLFEIGKKSLINDIMDKWLNNETYMTHYFQLEQDHKTQLLLLSEINKQETELLERKIVFPDGTEAIQKTAKFWNIQLEHKRFKDQLLIEGREEEPSVRQERMKDIKTLSREEKEARYNLRRCGGVQE